MSTYTQEGAARSGTWRRLAAVAGAVASLAAFAPAHAQQAASAANGDSNGEPEYVWNELQGEKLIALRAKGDPARGEITFEVCQGCHRSHALGRPDGSYPRLAGQHDTVLIKQMTDVRAGRRKNDKMAPFIEKHGISPQDIADIAAFLTRLPVPPNNGKGPGTDLAVAEKTYQERCAVCHGKAGQGDEAKFYPRVSGQHFKYMLREMKDIRDGVRGNANSDMIQVVRTMSDAQLESVADYMSRLPVAAK